MCGAHDGRQEGGLGSVEERGPSRPVRAANFGAHLSKAADHYDYYGEAQEFIFAEVRSTGG